MYFDWAYMYNIYVMLEKNRRFEGVSFMKKEYTSPELEIIKLEEEIMNGEVVTSVKDPWDDIEGNL